MILRFLRLFATFRAIESHCEVLQGILDRDSGALVEETNRREAAESESAFWRARSEEWERRYIEANAGAILARETVADFMSQLRFGRKIFGQAPALPEKPADEMKPIPRSRVQARVVVQRAEAKYDQDIAAYTAKLREEAQARRDAAARPQFDPAAGQAETTP